MIINFKIFELIDHSDVDPYGEEKWEDNPSKLIIKKYQHNDNGSYNGHRFWVFKEDDLEVLVDLETGRFEKSYLATGLLRLRLKSVEPDEIHLIKSGEIILTNIYFFGLDKYRSWSYQDLVEKFGEENISFD